MQKKITKNLQNRPKSAKIWPDWCLMPDFGRFWPSLADFGRFFANFCAFLGSPMCERSECVRNLVLSLQSAELWALWWHFGQFWPILANFDWFWTIFGRFLVVFFVFPGCPMWERTKNVKKLATCLQSARLWACWWDFGRFWSFWSVLVDFGWFLANFCRISLHFLGALCESVPKL